jgi:hypothetical protein
MVMALVITMGDTDMVRVVVVAHHTEGGHVEFKAHLSKEPLSLHTTLIGSIECDSVDEARQVIAEYNAHPKRLSGGDISLSQVLDRVRGNT